MKNNATLRVSACFISLTEQYWRQSRLLPHPIRLPAGIAVLVWVGCWGVAYVYFNKGQYLLLRAKQALHGAVAEENVAQLLKPLVYLTRVRNVILSVAKNI